MAEDVEDLAIGEGQSEDAEPPPIEEPDDLDIKEKKNLDMSLPVEDGNKDGAETMGIEAEDKPKTEEEMVMVTGEEIKEETVKGEEEEKSKVTEDEEITVVEGKEKPTEEKEEKQVKGEEGIVTEEEEEKHAQGEEGEITEDEKEKQTEEEKGKLEEGREVNPMEDEGEELAEEEKPVPREEGKAEEGVEKEKEEPVGEENPSEGEQKSAEIGQEPTKAGGEEVKQVEEELKPAEEEEEEKQAEGEVKEIAEGEEAKEVGEEGKLAEREETKMVEGEPVKGEEGKPVEGEEEKQAEGKSEEEGKEEKETKARVDFDTQKESSFLELAPDIILDYSSSSVEEEEEEEEEEEVEEEEGIDREATIESYKALQAEGRPIVKKNVMLLKKMAEHYKRRKMEHVYKTPEPYSVDKEVRYHKQLLAFDEIRTTEANERSVITEELKAMRSQRNDLLQEFNEKFDNFLAKERENGIGLIYTKTGKVIPDRLVDQLLKRQKSKQKEINEVRLAFIKLRDRVAAKEALLRSLETFGENLHLIDFEQLKMENQNFADKIEERDEELQRLRNTTTSAIQIMAHMREKAFATDQKMDELSEQLEYTETEANNTRSYLTDLKKGRDFMRSETLRLRREAGLLAHPRLLEDFASSIGEAAHLSAQVQNLKNTFHDQQQTLSNLRKAIETQSSAPINKEPSTLSKIKSSKKHKPSVLKEEYSSVEQERFSIPHKSHVVSSPIRLPSLGVMRDHLPPLESRLEMLSTARSLQDPHHPQHSPIANRPPQDPPRASLAPITKERPSFFPSSSRIHMYGEVNTMYGEKKHYPI